MPDGSREKKILPIVIFFSTDKNKALFYAINEAFRMNKKYSWGKFFLLYENLLKGRDRSFLAIWKYYKWCFWYYHYVRGFNREICKTWLIKWIFGVMDLKNKKIVVNFLEIDENFQFWQYKTMIEISLFFQKFEISRTFSLVNKQQIIFVFENCKF